MKGGVFILLGAVGLLLMLLGLVRRLNSGRRSQAQIVSDNAKNLNQNIAVDQSAEKSVEHIFDDAFREELRNRGRLHFEKVIGENAMFLQQDLRQTTSQLTDYMRSELTRTLQDEFKKYEQSISDAKQLALESIDKTITTIDQQRQLLQTQLQTQAESQKSRIVAAFENEMASIVNHYVLRAIGNQIDLSNQLDYILAELEANKQAMVDDIKHGA